MKVGIGCDNCSALVVSFLRLITIIGCSEIPNNHLYYFLYSLFT
nr:MAG TPA: hypothetical protein [Caudoviricetes sp.]